MSRRPIDDAVAAIEAKITALERQLDLLRQAQALDVEATEAEQEQNNRLHKSDSSARFVPVQEHSDGPIGVRIAAGRKKQSLSRKAQLSIGLTDQAVADMLDVARLTVCKWHMGKTKIPARHADTLAALKPAGIPKSVWPKIGL